MKSLLVVFGILFGSILFFGQMPAYYQGIDFSQPAASVESELKTLITNTHNPLTYSNTYPWVKLIDQDENNTNNVILVYNGQSEPKVNTIGGGNTTNPEVWNREHIYPQSLISTTATGDLHHLRACDGDINNNRGNLPFVSGSGSYGTVSGGWYPGDEWKGDVARMIMYVHLRYDEPWTDVGTMSLFLQWNVDDPVSDFERQRNNTIQGAQGNRNPFIDQPYLATYLYGGPIAEDTWGWPNEVDEISLEDVSMYPNPINTTGSVTFSGVTTPINEVIFYDLSGKQIYTVRQPKVENQQVEISTSVSSGVYFVKLVADHAEVTKKLVVN
ncbi:MAG: endonuclease [Flavobacteriales bacterium]|nr:endonuclease [Flavobacteriales bacterium]